MCRPLLKKASRFAGEALWCQHHKHCFWRHVCSTWLPPELSATYLHWSSILMGLSIINQPARKGYPHYGKPQMNPNEGWGMLRVWKLGSNLIQWHMRLATTSKSPLHFLKSWLWEGRSLKHVKTIELLQITVPFPSCLLIPIGLGMLAFGSPSLHIWVPSNESTMKIDWISFHTSCILM